MYQWSTKIAPLWLNTIRTAPDLGTIKKYFDVMVDEPAQGTAVFVQVKNIMRDVMSFYENSLEKKGREAIKRFSQLAAVRTLKTVGGKKVFANGENGYRAVPSALLGSVFDVFESIASKNRLIALGKWGMIFDGCTIDRAASIVTESYFDLLSTIPDLHVEFLTCDYVVVNQLNIVEKQTEKKLSRYELQQVAKKSKSIPVDEPKIQIEKKDTSKKEVYRYIPKQGDLEIF